MKICCIWSEWILFYCYLAQLFHLCLHFDAADASPVVVLFVLLLDAGCLFKDWVWHSRGIWCLCVCIKCVCGLRQRWTDANPPATLHRTAPCFPPTSADLGKRLQCSLETCRPSHPLQVIFYPSLTHDYILWSMTHFQTLWSFHTEECYVLVLESLKWFHSSSASLHRSFCFFTSRNANQHLPFWWALIE